MACLRLLFFIALPVFGQITGNVLVNQGRPATSGNAWPVTCISGCSAVTNPSFGAAFPATGVAIGAIDSGGNLAGLNLTAGGLLKVDGSGATQPISGTVAATQSGTWTVQPGNTANTTPWLATISQGGNSATVSAGGALKVDGSAVTQPRVRYRSGHPVRYLEHWNGHCGNRN